MTFKGTVQRDFPPADFLYISNPPGPLINGYQTLCVVSLCYLQSKTKYEPTFLANVSAKTTNFMKLFCLFYGAQVEFFLPKKGRKYLNTVPSSKCHLTAVKACFWDNGPWHCCQGPSNPLHWLISIVTCREAPDKLADKSSKELWRHLPAPLTYIYSIEEGFIQKRSPRSSLLFKELN